MGLLDAMKNLILPPAIQTPEALRGFLESRSAYLVQKSITEYCQARANMMFSTLMRERLFLEGYEKARWQSFPAAISMVAEMIEGTLREQAGTAPGALDAALLRLAAAIVDAYPAPSGLGADFWRTAAERVSKDLAQAALGPPKAVSNIPYLRCREIFDVLPIAPHIREHDFPMFQNTIRFHLTEIKAEFEEKAKPDALAAALSS